MGSYRSPSTMMPEANRNLPPNFQWFHPSFFSSSRAGFNPFQGIRINSNPVVGGGSGGVAAIPVQSLVSPNEVAQNNENEVGLALVQSTKAKKPKTSKKSTDCIIPEHLKPKQPKKEPSRPKKMKATSSSSAKRERKNLNFVMYEGNVDLSGVPAPFCSCTGVTRQCYRWGVGGWQSSCCTTNISEYPPAYECNKAWFKSGWEEEEPWSL